MRYACIRHSGIILIPKATFVPNSVSFAASIAELAHGEKLRIYCSLFDAPGTKALVIRDRESAKTPMETIGDALTDHS